ncbi:MAG: type II secretion system protein, partial [Bacilli bacterium]
MRLKKHLSSQDGYALLVVLLIIAILLSTVGYVVGKTYFGDASSGTGSSSDSQATVEAQSKMDEIIQYFQTKMKENVNPSQPIDVFNSALSRTLQDTMQRFPNLTIVDQPIRYYADGNLMDDATFKKRFYARHFL